MINIFLTTEVRSKKYGEGFRIRNLEEDKPIILLKAFKQLYRKILYQIYTDIDGFNKEDADLKSRRITNLIFKRIL